MKKRRAARSEIEKLSTMVILWHDIIFGHHVWRVSRFTLTEDKQDVEDIWLSDAMESSSFEEAFLKAIVAFPGEKIFSLEKTSYNEKFICPLSFFDVFADDEINVFALS